MWQFPKVVCFSHGYMYFGFYQYGDYLDKNFTMHGNVHLGWIEANANRNFG
jgi:hypothetical protein